MKKQTSLSIISVILLLLLTVGCSKKSSNNSTSSPYTMTATITSPTGNKTSFSASGSLVSAQDSSGIATISGGMATNNVLQSTISMDLFNYTGTGTYYFNDTTYTNLGSYYVVSTPSSTTNIAHGFITITSTAGEVVKGSFSLTLTDSTTITNGVFTAAGKGF